MFRGRTNEGLNQNNATTGTGRTTKSTTASTAPADSSIRRSATSTTQPATSTARTRSTFGRNTMRNPITSNHGIVRSTRYRDTAADARNSKITFIVLLAAIVALLAIAIYALMRRPNHGVSDNDSANRRR